jgi:hypothetical protein
VALIALGALATGASLVTLDSLYCSYIGDPSTLHLVVTPWNAFRYNRKTANLATHGLHPRYLHLLVNLPLLFGLQGFQGLWTALSTQAVLLRMWRPLRDQDPSLDQSTSLLADSEQAATSLVASQVYQSAREPSSAPWPLCPPYHIKSRASWSLWWCH